MRLVSSSRPVRIDESSAATLAVAMGKGLPREVRRYDLGVLLTRLDLRGAGPDVRDRLPRPDLGGAAPVEAVREILAEVKKRGDAAVREYSQRFDGVAVGQLSVDHAELDAALADTPPLLREALEAARASILAYHRTQLREETTHERDGVAITEL